MTFSIMTVLRVTTHRIRAGLSILVLLSGILAGCSGGGSSSSPSGTSPPNIYNGITTQARLTGVNAPGYFTLLWNGGGSLDGASTAARTAKTSTVLPSAAHSPLAGILRIARLTASQKPPFALTVSGSAKRVASMVPINTIIQGEISGTMTLDGTIDNSNGRGTITIAYHNFNRGDGYTHNGGTVLRVDSIDLTSGTLLVATFSFDSWEVTDNSGTMDSIFTGSIRMEAQSNSVLTINLEGRDNKTGETFRLSDFIITSGYNNASPSQQTETMSGRVFRSTFGYVELATTTPLTYPVSPSGGSSNPDGGGPLVLMGAEASRAVITPLSYGIRIDLTINGLSTIVGRYFWDNLFGPSLTGLTVTPAAPRVPAGLTQQFIATGSFSDNTTKDLTRLVTWTTDDRMIAQISSRESSYSSCMEFGCATALSLGTTSTTATLGDMSTKTVMVVDPPVLTGITVVPHDSSLPGTIAIGMERQLDVIGNYSDNNRGDATNVVTWSSSNPEVATVSNSSGRQGIVTALKSGTVTISANSGKLTNTLTLTVTSWAARTAGTSANLYRATWSGQQFLVLGSDGTILTSPDGTTFTPAVSGTTATLFDVVWGGGRYVAVGAGGTVLTSSDGYTWAAQPSGFTDYLFGVTWTGSRFVAVGGQGGIITSPDGLAWTRQTSGTINTLHGVVWTGDTLVTVGQYGIILTSSDGTAWSAQTSNTLNNLGKIVWSGSRLVALSSGDPNSGYEASEFPFHTSPDGITWNNVSITPYFIWAPADLAWCGGNYLTVGDNGLLFSSSDGTAWTQFPVGTNSFLYGIGCSGARTLIVGPRGLLLSTP